jgi:Ca2+-binding EF-hand superfamily protein
LKDFDFLNDGTIGPDQLKKILRVACNDMTSGDVDFFINTLLKEGKGKIISKDLLMMVNENIYENEDKQELKSHLRDRYFQ